MRLAIGLDRSVLAGCLAAFQDGGGPEKWWGGREHPQWNRLLAVLTMGLAWQTAALVMAGVGPDHARPSPHLGRPSGRFNGERVPLPLVVAGTGVWLRG